MARTRNDFGRFVLSLRTASRFWLRRKRYSECSGRRVASRARTGEGCLAPTLVFALLDDRFISRSPFLNYLYRPWLYHFIPEGGGGALPSNGRLRMCRWMGSHFHDSTDYNGVAFSSIFNRVTRMGSHFFGTLRVRKPFAQK